MRPAWEIIELGLGPLAHACVGDTLSREEEQHNVGAEGGPRSRSCEYLAASPLCKGRNLEVARL
eukprot:CAMPEP_0197916670 /NCGR_PEP_ID=MMETSP1439-20131203/82413_1 /TAXON_ID=66791 /ORGANISM="Gonyaulax spinifera, Strain CCMP409" /LENGTH=63 /DNA_ID=CAMNT_0043538707 /DNA_START=184 /DNA_END=372 /DNA_ORIENTATION=-